MQDPRNKLNNLSNTQWLIETKSVWYSKPPQRDRIKKNHPATFAESDIERLINFFTKPNEKVLDPFLGTGSTLIACVNTGRQGTGIELVDEWIKVAHLRLSNLTKNSEQHIVHGDTRLKILDFEPESFDFIVTSPPYWMILNKDTDHKATNERANKGLNTKYSEIEDDLGNLRSYDEFLCELQGIFHECWRVLHNRKYMCVIVSDFRHKSEFVPYHSDISDLVEAVGFTLEGITILVQDNKKLYPYGIPHAFVSNIHHQYILIFRKKCQ